MNVSRTAVSLFVDTNLNSAASRSLWFLCQKVEYNLGFVESVTNVTVSAESLCEAYPMECLTLVGGCGRVPQPGAYCARPTRLMRKQSR